MRQIHNTRFAALPTQHAGHAACDPASLLRMRHLVLLVATAVLCLPVSSAAQAAAPETGAGWTDNTNQAPATGKVLPSEGLGADDLLDIRVSYCPELTRNFRVSSDGTLSLPLLHRKLMVSGLTPIQVADTLQQELEKEKLLVDPTVTVSVLEYRSRPVSVVGAVNHPLTFQATGQTTLLDAIAQAGGLSPNAGGDVIVASNSGPQSGPEGKTVQIIRVQDLIGGKVPNTNLQLHGGEEIRIPEASKIFIAGNVKRPGMYPMQGDQETTIIKAIALSEGLESFGADDAFIYRLHGGGQREEVKVPLKKILTHKSPDMALMADDILFIPGSDGKRLTSKILNGLAGMGQAAGAGILIYK